MEIKHQYVKKATIGDKIIFLPAYPNLKTKSWFGIKLTLNHPCTHQRRESPEVMKLQVNFFLAQQVFTIGLSRVAAMFATTAAHSCVVIHSSPIQEYQLWPSAVYVYIKFLLQIQFHCVHLSSSFDHSL